MLYIFPFRGQNAPVGAEQRVLHHFTQQHAICTVFDTCYTLHGRKWLFKRYMIMVKLSHQDELLI
jgi:hypothetical protein